jgi:hypothetical protein
MLNQTEQAIQPALTSLTDLQCVLSNNSPTAAVAQFIEEFGVPIPPPGQYHKDRVLLGINLVVEEMSELLDEMKSVRNLALEDNREGVAEQLPALFKEMADVQYVIHYLSLAFGYDFDPVFNLVHWSNMTKTKGDGPAIGKIQKGPNYQPPNIKGELVAQAGDYHYFGDGYATYGRSGGGRVEAVLDQEREADSPQRGGFTARSHVSIQDRIKRLFRSASNA